MCDCEDCSTPAAPDWDRFSAAIARLLEEAASLAVSTQMADLADEAEDFTDKVVRMADPRSDRGRRPVQR